MSGEARSAVGSSGWSASGRAMPMRSVAPLVMASVMPAAAAEPTGDQQRHGGDGAHAFGEVEEERFAAAGALERAAVAHGG